jgi:hydroxyacylglutathione hydrolase
MQIQQLYTKCLAQGAYFIAHNGEAAVIDPLRETQPYLDLAKENNCTIKYIFETHFHADFVSGHVDLSKATGAPIVYGNVAKTGFESIGAAHNEEFKIGELTLKVLHTPGHTPESVCYLLSDENGLETAIFTGDTLFLGDVGRPDLAIKGNLTQEDLAGMLFDSLRNEILPLPNNITVYPAHGAGSSCGKNMSSETSGNLGEQKMTNYALRSDMTRDEFINEVTEGILPPPQYFPKNAQLNKNGYSAIDQVLSNGTTALSITDFKTAISKGALILDVRTQQDFIKGFIPNSLFIGLNGTFAMWVGALIKDITQSIVLICPEGSEQQAVLRLARVGYDNCLGFLKGGIEGNVNELGKLNTITSVEASSLVNDFTSKKIIDVRKPSEFENAHLENATLYPLDYIFDDLNHLHKNETYHIHCAGGYRSIIAISILMQNGYTNLIDIAGGYSSISKEENLPFVLNQL